MIHSPTRPAERRAQAASGAERPVTGSTTVSTTVQGVTGAGEHSAARTRLSRCIAAGLGEHPGLGDTAVQELTGRVMAAVGPVIDSMAARVADLENTTTTQEVRIGLLVEAEREAHEAWKELKAKSAKPRRARRPDPDDLEEQAANAEQQGRAGRAAHLRRRAAEMGSGGEGGC